MSDRRSENLELVSFLVLVCSTSAVWNTLIVRAGGMANVPGYVDALMWSPALSAFAVMLIFRRTLRGLGWRWPATRWALLGYVVPIAYALAAYGVVLLAGLSGLDLAKGPQDGLKFVFLGTLITLATGLGEELGWRGYLVPALARTMSLGRVAVVSGVIWALWHAPLIILGGYNAGTPLPYALACFAVGVVAMSYPLAWLRLRSGSVWPAALFHASHNLYIQGFLDPVTVDLGRTHWLTGEFGVALALTLCLTAWLFWRAGPASPDGRQMVN